MPSPETSTPGTVHLLHEHRSHGHCLTCWLTVVTARLRSTETPARGGEGTALARLFNRDPAASHQKKPRARPAHAVVGSSLSEFSHKSWSARWRRSCRQRRTGACPSHCALRARARPKRGEDTELRCADERRQTLAAALAAGSVQFCRLPSLG